MFKVSRPDPAPKGLKKGYNSPDVIKTLKKTFYSKCYLCETKNPEAPEVEHFIPKSKDDKLERDWKNLFYVCRRCNSIKGKEHVELLNCTTDEVFKPLLCMLPTLRSYPIEVSVIKGFESAKATNTANLLTRCYNRDESGGQQITRSNLRRGLEKTHLRFSHLREKLLNEDTGRFEKFIAADQLQQMLQPEYRYSCFWKRKFLEDEELMEDYDHLLNPTKDIGMTVEGVLRLMQNLLPHKEK